MKQSVTHLQAIGFALAGFTLWVLADSSIKFAGQSRLPAYEVTAIIGFFIGSFVFAWRLAQGGVAGLWPRQPRRQMVRSCLDLGNNCFVVVALRHLPLTTFYILVFCAPMVVAVLAAIFLGELLDWRKVVAIAVGFAGVLVAVGAVGPRRPGDWIGFLACAICVACFSTNIVWSRRMAQHERADSLTFFSGLCTALAGGAAMLFHASPVSLRVLAALIATAAFCTIGNLCFFVALRHATAATVSQYHYTQLVTGTLIAYVVWQERLTLPMLLGALLITGSGLYIALTGSQHGPAVVPVE